MRTPSAPQDERPRRRPHPPSLDHLGVGLVVLLLGLGASGCSLIPTSGPAPDRYVLQPDLSAPRETLAPVDWELAVEEPVASGGLGTDRIAVKPDPHQIQHYAGARWAERAPKMLQTLILESLEASGSLVGVTRQSIGLRNGYVLRTDLRDFQSEYYERAQPPLVRVRLRARLAEVGRERVVASETFESAVRAEGRSVEDIVHAFDQASSEVIRRLATWVLTAPRGASGAGDADGGGDDGGDDGDGS